MRNKTGNIQNVPVDRFSDLGMVSSVVIQMSHIYWDGEWVANPNLIYTGKLQPIYFNQTTKETSYVLEKGYVLYGYVCYNAEAEAYNGSEWVKQDDTFVVTITAQNFDSRSPCYILG